MAEKKNAPRLGNAAGSVSSLMASLTCILIYIVMAPLLPPMMIFRRKYFTALWLKNFANHLPLMVLIILRTGVTLFLAVRPLYQLFHVPRWILLLVAVPLVILISRSDWMIGRYLEMEARFLSNFNEKKLQELKEKGKDTTILAVSFCVKRVYMNVVSLLSFPV